MTKNLTEGRLDSFSEMSKRKNSFKNNEDSASLSWKDNRDSKLSASVGNGSTLNKKPFYLRGYLKEHKLDEKHLSKGNVSIKEMNEMFDDEEEKFQVKMVMKDLL